MNRLDRNPNDPPTPREVRARRLGSVMLVACTVALILLTIGLGYARFMVFTGGAGSDVFQPLILALMSFVVLVLAFVTIVLAVLMKNIGARQFATVIAVLVTINGVVALLGF